ncbi:MAG: adenosine kinase [Desulfobacteraceae bacterium]|nr:adenosine kinase [Desulfobacteraceae bacterium]
MRIYEKMKPQREKVTGVGSALVDILAREDDSFLQRVGAIKGGMTYTEKDFIDQAVHLTTTPPQLVPGGSACNTVVGISRLGGKSQFIGKCGRGPMGQLFRKGLERQGVESMLFTSASYTGRVLSIVTPDAQRSMLTYLGASAETRPDEISPECFQDAAIVHIEGYLLFNPDLILAVLNAAQQAGAVISLDLASFNVVEEARGILPDLIRQYVDILIANEDEAFAYTRSKSESDSLRALSADANLAILKLGARGSLVAHDGRFLSAKAKGDGQAIDTTGAGDLWASGFLYGLSKRLPLEQCMDLGSVCGYEVCQVMGATIPDERWKAIHNYMEAQWPKNVLPAKS